MRWKVFIFHFELFLLTDLDLLPGTYGTSKKNNKNEQKYVEGKSAPGINGVQPFA